MEDPKGLARLLIAVLIIFWALLLYSWSYGQTGRDLLLTWKDNSNNEDGFKIERMTGTDGSWAEVGTVAANIKTYTDSLADSQQYCYRVLAFNNSGLSGPSNTACDPTVPDGDPNNLTIRRVP